MFDETSTLGSETQSERHQSHLDPAALVSAGSPQAWLIILALSGLCHVGHLLIHLCWSSETEAHISPFIPSSAFLHEASDPSQQVPLVDSSLQTPVGLALDWLQHNLYWTDSGDKSISVASVDGTKRRVLISSDLSEPRAIALDPHHG